MTKEEARRQAVRLIEYLHADYQIDDYEYEYMICLDDGRKYSKGFVFYSVGACGFCDDTARRVYVAERGAKYQYRTIRPDSTMVGKWYDYKKR